MAGPDTSSCLTPMQLDQYLEGTLSDTPLLEHMANCPVCQQQLEEHRANNALLRQISDWPLTPGSRRSAGNSDIAGLIDIDGYELQHELHHGSQGVVVRAVQRSANRVVALKLLRSGAFATSSQRRRFEREIELVAGLDHPGIVTVYDSGVTGNGELFLAMQFIDGRTLDCWHESLIENLSPSDRDAALHRVLRLFITVCDAVHHAHLRGIIHRDLKPGNILVDADDQPHVLDFGLAKPIDGMTARTKHTVTQAGQFMGTIAYAAPEQTTGDPYLVDIRSDVYALGAILYELLTGQLPIELSPDLRESFRAIAEDPPMAPSRQSDAPMPIDRDMDTIVLHALSKDKARRYQSARALRDDIEHYLRREPIDARRDNTWYVWRKTLARHRIPIGVAGLFVTLLLVFSVSMSVLYRRASIETDKVKQINIFLEDTLGSLEPMTPGEAVTVRDMLDEAAQWIDIALTDKPEVRAAIHTTIGNGYRALGAFDEADTHLSESLRIREQLFGTHDDQVAQSLNALGMLRHSEGRLSEAEQLLHRALAIRDDLLGRRSYEASLTHANLARVYRDMNDYERAEVHLRTSLDVRRTLFGDEHQDVAMCLYSLGVLADLQQQYSDALVLHRDALRIRLAVLHRDHPDVDRSQYAVGRLLLTGGEAEQALTPLRKCMDARTRRLGANHWRTAEAACAVAEAYIALDRFSDGVDELVPAVAILRRALGDDDQRTRSAIRLLSFAGENLGPTRSSDATDSPPAMQRDDEP